MVSTLISLIKKTYGEKDYKIYDKDNRIVEMMKGESLYSNHYDKVESSVRKRYEKSQVETIVFPLWISMMFSFLIQTYLAFSPHVPGILVFTALSFSVLSEKWG